MAKKRFKFGLCSLFNSCRSKDSLPIQPRRFSSLCRPNNTSSASDAVVTGPLSPLISVTSASKGKNGPRQQRRSRRRKPSAAALPRPRLSTSSADTCLFSEEEMDREMEMLVSHSSRSFYTDSSTDFSPHLETIREGPAFSRRRKRGVLGRGRKKTPASSTSGVQERTSDAGEEAPARLSAVFQRLMPCAAVEVEGKVRESFAVVKRSEDPYEDFRRSMAEMIVEKEMVEEADLKELLRCFLSLNSEHHHGIIITAFNDIWHAFFSNPNSTLPNSTL